MKIKRGQIGSETVAWVLAIAAGVIVIGLGYLFFSGYLDNYIYNLPDLNGTNGGQGTESAIIRNNNRNLEYYDGTNWKVFSSDISLGDKVLDPVILQAQFFDIYFNTLKVINDQKSGLRINIEAVSLIDFNVTVNVPNPSGGASDNYVIKYDNVLSKWVDDGWADIPVSEMDDFDRAVRDAVVAWRDEPLKKPHTFSYISSSTKEPVFSYYCVEKIGYTLRVDLSKPVAADATCPGA